MSEFYRAGLAVAYNDAIRGAAKTDPEKLVTALRLIYERLSVTPGRTKKALATLFRVADTCEITLLLAERLSRENQED